MSRRLADGGASYAFTKPVLHYNRVSSFSAWALALAQIPFIINFFWSLKHGAKTEANAWQATTLEWAAAGSPPGHGNFKELPVVYRGPYEYSVPGAPKDFTPQCEKAGA
jgi:cytochrome c oxidase subunit 1